MSGQRNGTGTRKPRTALNRSGKPLNQMSDRRKAKLKAAGTFVFGSTFAARPARIKPVSDKRAEENKQRRELARLIYPERPPCGVAEALDAAGLPPLPVCTGWADDLHETLSRARSGGLITDPSIWCPSCRPCHDVLTFKPESELPPAIYQLKLLVHSWEATVNG